MPKFRSGFAEFGAQAQAALTPSSSITAPDSPFFFSLSPLVVGRADCNAAEVSEQLPVEFQLGM